MPKKILWFSRHSMSANQLEDLRRVMGGDVHITQVSGQPHSVDATFEAMSVECGETTADVVLEGKQPSLKDLVKGFDEVAAVLPIGMLHQLIPLCPSGRVLQAVSSRVLLFDGGTNFNSYLNEKFVHEKWQAVKEIRIVTEDLHF